MRLLRFFAANFLRDRNRSNSERRCRPVLSGGCLGSLTFETPGQRLGLQQSCRKNQAVLAPERTPHHIRAMKFTVTIDRDESGAWVAECPAIPGCVSQGATKPEALKNVREAIELCLEVRAERGLPLTIETKQVEVAV